MYVFDTTVPSFRQVAQLSAALTSAAPGRVDAFAPVVTERQLDGRIHVRVIMPGPDQAEGLNRAVNDNPLLEAPPRAPSAGGGLIAGDSWTAILDAQGAEAAGPQATPSAAPQQIDFRI